MARASRMASVHRSFEVIHKALTFEDALFAESGEAIAFVEALDSYRDFLETTIVPNVGAIVENDPSDKLLAGGFGKAEQLYSMSSNHSNEISNQVT
ncbi:hypothetical protein [uncultured Mobiluncus sp.]|uniref:hypothetical protein n=1 Tax=uncultured Mobiluncus sp. TaxID=293425 RepID=UPI00141EAED2|nr:hypothetical protein [uncultured Mobiluncus sp.]